MRVLEGRAEELEERAEAMAGTFNAQNVANTLWAYAKMGREPGSGLMRAALRSDTLPTWPQAQRALSITHRQSAGRPGDLTASCCMASASANSFVIGTAVINTHTHLWSLRESESERERELTGPGGALSIADESALDRGKGCLLRNVKGTFIGMSQTG